MGRGQREGGDSGTETKYGVPTVRDNDHHILSIFATMSNSY